MEKKASLIASLFDDDEKIEIEYNRYGHKVLKRHYDAQDKKIDEEKINIEYDAYENIVKAELFKNGKMDSYLVRNYTYY